MQLNPYLNFPGTCAEAFRFYEKALGGKIEMLQTQNIGCRIHAPYHRSVRPKKRDDRGSELAFRAGDRSGPAAQINPHLRTGLDFPAGAEIMLL